jgi:C1A family cysteine protease
MEDTMAPAEFSLARLQQTLREAGARWDAGVTSVSELPPDQKRRRLGYVPGPDEEPLETRERVAVANFQEAQAAKAEARAAAYPASFDLRNVAGKNYITPIKDQGGCGSCVAFGTAATVEGTLRWQRNDPNLVVDYSEAQLFYCIAREQGSNCTSGWDVGPALDAFEETGIVDEACFPYTAGDQGCGLCGDWQSRVTKITGWHSISSHDEMKQWLSTRGPLSTCFTVYDDFFNYKGGVYSHVSGDFAGGHCVSCVGYNDAEGYWICKNSWGAGFGEGGYFRIAYGQVGIDSTMWAVEGIQAGLAFSGAWRAGSDPYYLWVNANWSNFTAKWDELSKQNLRLVDLDTYTVDGQRLWAGVWRAGSDNHYLWANADWSHFKAKWDDLAKQNLRLTALTTYEQGGTRLYAGVWRAGSDAYYLWTNATWANFAAKWDELSKQNLRLVDLDTYTVGGQRLWAGVWRAGSDAHYLWVNADWSHFKAKWDDLAKLNLRLTVLTTYEEGGTRLYAGVWRAGSDAYYLWANASWDNFKNKWDELSKQNLRLIHLDTATLGATALAGGSNIATMVTDGSSSGARAGLVEGGGGDTGAASVDRGGGDAGQIGAGDGGGSGGQLVAGEGGGGSQLGAGEGGGGAGQPGVGEGGGGGGAGQVGAGEGGGSHAGQAGLGEGGGDTSGTAFVEGGSNS